MLEKLKFAPIILLFLASCSNEVDMLKHELEIEDVQTITAETGIELKSGNISMTDAETVALLYQERHMNTRVGENPVRNIVTILGKDSEPAIYAVNFRDGYILVSANTAFPPILAEVERGNYSISRPEMPEDVIISELVDNLQYIKDKGGDAADRYRTEWLPYLKSQNPNKKSSKTRFMDDDAYWEALDSWYLNYDTSDPEVCRITSVKGQGSLSDEEYYRITEFFYEEDLWEGTDYRWENTAYLVIERNSDYYNVEPLLKTNWNQKGDFNITYKDALGCVPVAVGQIMRFFEYPGTFNWANMPHYWITPEIQEFLAKLSYQICSDGTSANISDAKKTLEDYGYKVRKIKHDTSALINQIGKNRKPVYARGQKNILSSGHAWVIDGAYFSHSGTSYKLYYLDPDYYPDFVYRYEEMDFDSNYSEICKFHMNWGWGGSYNGWYFDYDKLNPGGENFSSYREELIIDL